MQHLALHVVGLVDLAFVTIHREEIVSSHVGDIIKVAGHHRQFGKPRSHVIVVDPEKGIRRCIAAELVSTTHEDGAKSSHLGLEGARALVHIYTFLDVVTCCFSTWNVAVSNSQLATILLVIDAIALQHVLHGKLILLVERLVAVQLIGIGIDAACEDKAEEVGEEVHLSAHRLYGIVHRCVLVFRQVKLAIDITFPNHIFRHGCCSGEHKRCTVGGRGFRCLFSLFGRGISTTLCRLSLCGTCHEECDRDKKKYALHSFCVSMFRYDVISL